MGRIATLLSHYYRDTEDADELIEAQMDDWIAVVGGLSKEIIQAACLAYLRDEPRRKPTPGAIYDMAKRLMPAPRVGEDTKPQVLSLEHHRQIVTPEQRARILAEYGITGERLAGISLKKMPAIGEGEE